MLQLPPEFHAPSYRNRYADLAGLRRSQLREHWRKEGRRSRRNAAPVENRQELLACLGDATQLLEIGPFDNPSLEKLRRSGLQIDYADYLSREDMVERARMIPGRVPAAIPPIRYVLGQGGYDQIETHYDAVVSHHCVEHQPDLIGHLLQVSRLLRPSGVYLFTVPDQQLCFDRYLPPSTLVDVIAAHLEERTRPPLQAVLEHRCFTVEQWSSATNPLEHLQPHLRQLLDSAFEEYQSHPYVDVHCWKFTAERFRRLLRHLLTLGYLPEATCWQTYNLGSEFACALRF